MATFKAVLNNKPKADGTHTILLRITHNRKLKHISLGHSVKKKDFNPNARNGNYVRSSNPEHKIINKHVEEQILEAKKKTAQLKLTTTENIKKAVKGGDGESFFEFAKSLVKCMEANPENFGSYRRYKSIIQKLKDYQKGKDLLFGEIDHSFLENYRNYLYGIGNTTNTVSGNFKVIRTILYEAIRQGKVKQEKNPFFTFKLDYKKPFKEALNQSEIQAILDLDLKPGSLIWHVRNYFLISFYLHGIRSGDLIQLKFKNIQEGRLVYQMGKTNTVINIKLNEKALDIFSYYWYEGANPEYYIFPLLDNNKDYSDHQYLFNCVSSKNALINKYLKKIAEQAGIHKNLSFHIARHSFATIARNKIGDISKIQKMLGHSDIKITQAYLASLTDTSLDHDSEMIYK